MKFWRTYRAHWQAMKGPQQIYYKRCANVLFDQAECRFKLNGEADPVAWGIVNDIREGGFLPWGAKLDRMPLNRM